MAISQRTWRSVFVVHHVYQISISVGVFVQVQEGPKSYAGACLSTSFHILIFVLFVGKLQALIQGWEGTAVKYTMLEQSVVYNPFQFPCSAKNRKAGSQRVLGDDGNHKGCGNWDIPPLSLDVAKKLYFYESDTRTAVQKVEFIDNTGLHNRHPQVSNMDRIHVSKGSIKLVKTVRAGVR